MPREQALYIIARKDLKRSNPIAQAVHAAVGFVLENDTDWRNGTLVCLGAKDEDQLLQLKESLDGRVCFEFREPDLENQLTAIAVLGSEEARLSDFPHLRLL